MKEQLLDWYKLKREEGIRPDELKYRIAKSCCVSVPTVEKWLYTQREIKDWHNAHVQRLIEE